MELIERLELLRILESDFFGLSTEKREALSRANDMLDECLKVVRKWLKENQLDNI